MAGEAALSICVPSRNRQQYFKETILSLTASPRSDIEFVFADNSDDPEIMNAFMERFRGDPRVVYLPSGERTYSMMENWERSVAAATGKWVSAIGDDDYLDPEVAALLLNLSAKVGPVDALTWSGINYIWPEEGLPPKTVFVSLSNKVSRFEKMDLMQRAFSWRDSLHVPLCGNSLYHGAISRELLHKIRKVFGGRFFEFPIIDYEIAFKVILAGKHFYNVSRPFSVLGVCPLANSATMGDLEAEARAVERFNREVGYDINEDPLLADTPFRTDQGVTSSIYVIQHWMARKYGFNYSGFEENLVRAMAANCNMYRDRESFDIMVGRYHTAISDWKEGRYLPYFTPSFSEPAPAPAKPRKPWYGVTADKKLYFPDNAGDATTPGELFNIVTGIVTPASEIPIAL